MHLYAKTEQEFFHFYSPNLFYTKKPMGYIKKQGTWMDTSGIKHRLIPSFK
jgi:hypothetical protein